MDVHSSFTIPAFSCHVTVSTEVVNTRVIIFYASKEISSSFHPESRMYRAETMNRTVTVLPGHSPRETGEKYERLQ
jgi:hypothetical protein